MNPCWRITRCWTALLFIPLALSTASALVASQQSGPVESLESNSSTVNSDAANPDTAYLKIRKEYGQQLERLAAKCMELDKPDLANYLKQRLLPRDPARSYFYLTPAYRTKQFPELTDDVDQFWKENLDKANRNYSARLLKLARQLTGSGDESSAYCLLHEALWMNPGNREIKNILGETEEVRTRIRSNPYRVDRRRDRDRFLPAGETLRVSSDNFELFTSIGDQKAQLAIASFERWHIVWRQLFYSYWASPRWLSRRFENGGRSLRRTKKFRVVLYSNREEYLKLLQESNPGIEVSTGFYSFDDKTSYFYVGEDVGNTWIHELTHQLMRESIPVARDSEVRTAIWAVEGIAIFMESLQVLPDCYAVGGEDAERLQLCRHHYFRREFFWSIQKLNALERTRLLAHEEVRALYSLSAGYCHYLMNQRNHRKEFYDFLRTVHQGRSPDRSFERLVEAVDLEDGFKKFLGITKERIERSLIPGKDYRVLFLAGESIDDQTLMKIRTATRMETLDLGRSKISDKGLKALAGMTQLKYLSLERTRITNDSAEVIARFRELQELDLTTTLVGDELVSRIAAAPRLVVLWLGGTLVSDKAIPFIGGMPALRQIDVRKTGVSPAGKKILNQKLRLID